MAVKEYLQRNLRKVVQKQKTLLGTLAYKSEVAEADLASALATKINGKADQATTIQGYGITDAYTKTETDQRINAQIDKVYKPSGNVEFADLVSALLIADNLGNVYNVTDGGTTTADFVVGAGKVVPAGADVSIVDVGTSESPAYKFNVLAGFMDLSNYATLGTTLAHYGITDAMTATEIAAAIADFITLTDLNAQTSGTGNVVTNVSYDNTTGMFTATKGDTAVMTSELVDFTDAEVDALFADPTP